VGFAFSPEEEASRKQVAYSEDVMSRIGYATKEKGGLKRLNDAIIKGLNQIADEADLWAKRVEYVELTLEPDFNKIFTKSLTSPHAEDKFPHLKDILPSTG
jgi:uncharacterized 2Fe-2S/4Fe-4S cluster protein (DUF4445 family)